MKQIGGNQTYIGSYKCHQCKYFVDGKQYPDNWIECSFNKNDDPLPLHKTLMKKFNEFVEQNTLAHDLDKEHLGLLQAAFNNGAAVAVDYLINVKNTLNNTTI